MRRALLLLSMLFFVVPVASAQKRCKKGIPCGNTCISAAKTCRIGTPTPAPQIEQRRIVPSTDQAADSAAPWVASSRGKTYYMAGCAGAKQLAPATRIGFKSEEDAKKAGYRRSTQKGC